MNTQTILREIEEFLNTYGVSATAFGIKAKKKPEPSFVSELRNGRIMRLDTAEEVRRFMEEYRANHDPKGANN